MGCTDSKNKNVEQPTKNTLPMKGERIGDQMQGSNVSPDTLTITQHPQAQQPQQAALQSSGIPIGGIKQEDGMSQSVKIEDIRNKPSNTQSQQNPQQLRAQPKPEQLQDPKASQLKISAVNERQLQKPLEIDSLKNQPITGGKPQILKPPPDDFGKIPKEKHEEIVNLVDSHLTKLESVFRDLAQNVVDYENAENESLGTIMVEILRIKKDLENSSDDIKAYPFENQKQILEKLKVSKTCLTKLKAIYDNYKKNHRTYADFRSLVKDLLAKNGVEIPEKTQWTKKDNGKLDFPEEINEENNGEFDFDFDSKKESQKMKPDSKEKMPTAKKNDHFQEFSEKSQENIVQFNLIQQKEQQAPEKTTVAVVKIEKIEQMEIPASKNSDNNNAANDSTVQKSTRDVSKFDKLEKFRFIKERDSAKFELENLVRGYNRKIKDYQDYKNQHQEIHRDYTNMQNEMNMLKHEMNQYDYDNEMMTVENDTTARTISNLEADLQNLIVKSDRIRNELAVTSTKSSERQQELLRLEQDPTIRKLQQEIAKTQEEVDQIQIAFKKAMNKYQVTSDEVTKERLAQIKKETNETVENYKLENIVQQDQELARKSFATTTYYKSSANRPSEYANPIKENARGSELLHTATVVRAPYTYYENYERNAVEDPVLINRDVVVAPSNDIANEKVKSSLNLLERARQIRESTLGNFAAGSQSDFEMRLAPSQSNDWLLRTEAKLTEISELKKALQGNSLSYGGSSSISRDAVSLKPLMTPGIAQVNGYSNGYGGVSSYGTTSGAYRTSAGGYGATTNVIGATKSGIGAATTGYGAATTGYTTEYRADTTGYTTGYEAATTGYGAATTTGYGAATTSTAGYDATIGTYGAAISGYGGTTSGYGAAGGYGTVSGYGATSGYGAESGLGNTIGGTYAAESGLGTTSAYGGGYTVESGTGVTKMYGVGGSYGLESDMGTISNYGVGNGYGITSGYGTTSGYRASSGYGATSSYAVTGGDAGVRDGSSDLNYVREKYKLGGYGGDAVKRSYVFEGGIIGV